MDIHAITEIFCEVDDFITMLQQHIDVRQLLGSGKMQRLRKTKFSISEMVTVMILFQHSHSRDFKYFYLTTVREQWRELFPNACSYNRFVNLSPRCLLVLALFLRCRLGKPTDFAFIDSTKLAVCHNKRIKRNRVFDGVATLGKSTMGWFYGFKLHLIINEHGEILAAHVTPANVDDRKPVEAMTKDLFGKLFGDKGYISQELFEKLYARGLKLVTHLRKNMKGRLMDMTEKIMLRKRSLIETINDQLKNICNIEHSRHRSVIGFMNNVLAALIGYSFQEKKPGLVFNWQSEAVATEKNTIMVF